MKKTLLAVFVGSLTMLITDAQPVNASTIFSHQTEIDRNLIELSSEFLQPMQAKQIEKEIIQELQKESKITNAPYWEGMRDGEHFLLLRCPADRQLKWFRCNSLNRYSYMLRGWWPFPGQWGDHDRNINEVEANAYVNGWNRALAGLEPRMRGLRYEKSEHTIFYFIIEEPGL